MQTLVTLAVSAALASGQFPVQDTPQRPETLVPVDFHAGLADAVESAISGAMNSANSGGSSFGRGNGNGNGNTGQGNGNQNSGNNNGNNNSGSGNGNNNTGNNNGNGNSGNNNGNNNETSGNGNNNTTDGNGNGSAGSPKPPSPTAGKQKTEMQKPSTSPGKQGSKVKGATGNDASNRTQIRPKRPCKSRTFLGIAVNNCNN